MKKLIFLLWIILVGCSDVNMSVYINSVQVDTIAENNNIYIDLEALEALDVDILRDLEKGHIYVSNSQYPSQLSNDRPYNWYLDQGDTGEYAGNNCGPSSVVMAALWQDETHSVTPEIARTLFKSDGGWWFTSDIEKYFKQKNISYEKDDYDSYTELLDALVDGHIVLLCIDTSFIDEIDEENSFIGKFYPYDGGHFIIVKGYIYIDGDLYFEVYDSNCWGEDYSDGSPKGKDRLYSEENISEAIEEWWDYYFIIENK